MKNPVRLLTAATMLGALALAPLTAAATPAATRTSAAVQTPADVFQHQAGPYGDLNACIAGRQIMLWAKPAYKVGNCIILSDGRIYFGYDD
ncbi:hypothetical protein [Kribbella italica]|uniref:Uncharacterized protein n=1 Tax=Kribbella italica TaxID=1540520 RepID=A0A7W9MWH0_9ACTN|nr:hypothetical protein [Kribbella italica]MBB5839026.1 hypothetical protein [Kribbella italica]